LLHFIPASSGECLTRRIEDEFGHVQQLILTGKERGYLLYDEINANACPQMDIHLWLANCYFACRRHVTLLHSVLAG
jgi:Sigma-70 factor, region 1.1